MKQAILDTSFILSCIRNKIDFFEQLKLEGFQIIIPLQVIKEIEGLSKSKNEAELALKLLRKNKFKKIDLNQKNVDKGLIQFAKKNKNAIIATLDREIKNKIKSPKLIIRGKKELEVI